MLSQVIPAALVSAAMIWFSQLWCVTGLVAVVGVFLIRPIGSFATREVPQLRVIHLAR